MKRLTFDGNFCDISMCRENPCPYNGACSQRKVWERLKYFEDREERSQWISVEERLPEVGQRVLVWCESRTIEKHITVSTFMQTYSTPRKTYFSRRVRNVTHWMPLPEPPEGGAEG